ncbi:hypothetical protein G7046_g1491 [Stylonectria norvegica]|nr:hypothetical protein G7046_g1491 [Stylonectria norvegica]
MFLHLLVNWVVGGWFMASSIATRTSPTVVDPRHDITYQGLHRNGIEVYLNIPYGQDTSGVNRFKPPKPYDLKPHAGTTVLADKYGPACPQPLGPWVAPISLSNITNISEDCLNLNVARPKATSATSRLPVMIYIHGGSFWSGQNSEITITPDGMIQQSVQNVLPIIHVAMNYRFGAFGFAQSNALKDEGSENAGLRDQRLAIEWVRDNIEHFGGDPNKITIFGQSSGGLSVGMHILAFGGTKPVPFQQGICESQALEPGITGNFTIDAMKALVDDLGCSHDLHSAETLDYLRSLDMETFLNASISTYLSDIEHNIGDIWLPVVDGDFLPAAPSQLIKEHRFANVTTMIGWCQDDLTFFTDTNIKTPEDTSDFISAYAPGLTERSVDKLLALYPSSEFLPNKDAGLSGEFYRSARIFRDVLMVCQPLGLAEQIAAAGNDVYLYEWNQTILDPILLQLTNHSGYGAIHTSEFAYIFGNLSHYDTDGYPFNPTKDDYSLRDRASRSWSTFAATGKPGLKGLDTFQGFEPAFAGEHTSVYVVGGPHEGLSPLAGPKAHPEVRKQRLKERCSFINSPEIIEQLQY